MLKSTYLRKVCKKYQFMLISRENSCKQKEKERVAIVWGFIFTLDCSEETLVWLTTDSAIPSPQFQELSHSQWLPVTNILIHCRNNYTSPENPFMWADHLYWAVLQDFCREETVWNRHALIHLIQSILEAKLSGQYKLLLQTFLKVDSMKKAFPCNMLSIILPWWSLSHHQSLRSSMLLVPVKLLAGHML